MRQLEPFSYYPHYASALRGFGGTAGAPDPRYCFHTHYGELLPGKAVFRLTLTGARASEGELTLRVHGYRPGPDSDITLVAGTRRQLATEGQNPATIEIAVSFVGLKGVQYAFYGFFSEHSDVQIDDVEITIEELGGSHAEVVEVPHVSSLFSNPTVISPDRLHTEAEPSLSRPVSQDFTFSQLPGGPAGTVSDADYVQWQTKIALGALEQYGQLDAGAHGLVRGDGGEPLVTALTQRGCRFGDPQAGHDFVICSTLEQVETPEQRYRLLGNRLSETLPGGLAIFFFRYSTRSGTEAAPGPITRNEIGQWALRLIGAGHDVAQLAFVLPAKRVADDKGRTPFVLICRAGVSN